MYNETARRIHDGLLHSLEGGDIKWLQGYLSPHPLSSEGSSGSGTSSVGGNGSVGGVSDVGSVHVSGEKGPPSSTNNTNTTNHISTTNTNTITNSNSTNTTTTSNNSNSNNTTSARFIEATAFLKDGFEELLKCRCVSILCCCMCSDVV